MGPDDDQPTRDRIGDWAYEKIRDGILDGELAAGTKLSIPDLARKLGVSRSPARESILRLIADGLAEEIPHRGAFVAEITRGDLGDLYPVRGVLEGLAARLAAERLPERGEEDLRSALSDHERALSSGDRYAITDADMAFHALMADLARNTWLKDSLSRLQSLVRLGMRSTMLVPGSAERALEEHRLILEAVVARDPVDAERRACDHIERLQTALQS